MADSIRSWICTYLIDTGETYGGSLADVPVWEKKKKVQLIEFLTFPNSGDDACPIFAKVSDKLHKIPVRFTADALDAFSKKNNGNRLTEYRNAIVQIKNFQPVFCRVPVGNNVRKLTIDYHLILEVGSIDVLGSEGEGEFGNPIDIDDNEKVMAWTKGLREHGGGGNVLKLRKEAELATRQADTSSTRAVPSGNILHNVPKRINQVGKKRAESGSKSTSVSPAKMGAPAAKHPLELYNKSFRAILKDTERFRIGWMPPEVKDQLSKLPFDKDLPVASTSRVASEEPPSPAQRRRSPPRRHALDLESSQPQIPSPERNNTIPPIPTTPTPSEWPPSPLSPIERGIIKMEVDSEHEMERRSVDALMSQQVDTANDDVQDHRPPKSSPTPSSRPTAPTPAQRPKSASPSASSSVPVHSLMTTSQPHSSPTTSLPVQMLRRVPYPSPPVPLDPDIPGFGRILVPNSDTSGQSQSQSQPRACSEQHAGQINFPTAAPQDLPRANRNDHSLMRNKANEQTHSPVIQPSLRPSQPDSYDGDRSSPEVHMQLDSAKEKQFGQLGALDATTKAKSLLASSQAKGHQESDAVKHQDQQDVDDQEEVDQLQSDNEDVDDGKYNSVTVEPPPECDLSDDDAQIHTMLTRKDLPQDPVPRKSPYPTETPAEILPPPAQINTKHSEGSGTTASRAPLVTALNDSCQQSRAPSPPSPLVPSNEMKHPKDNLPSTRLTEEGPSLRPAEVEHDADAWRNPSFMQNSKKSKTNAEPTAGTIKAPTQNERAAPPSHTTSSKKAPIPTNNSLHKSDVDSAKATSTDGGIGVQATSVAGPSKPDKRNRDCLSKSSSPDLGSGNRKKRKVETDDSGSRADSTSSGRLRERSHNVGTGAKGKDIKPSMITYNPPAGSESGSRKRRIEVGDRSESTSSGLPKAQDPSVRTGSSRVEKQNGKLLSGKDDQPLLRGYTFNLRHLPQKNGGPRLRTWSDLEATLLIIGRDRTPRSPHDS